MSLDDGKVFDRLFGPSAPPSIARSASETWHNVPCAQYGCQNRGSTERVTHNSLAFYYTCPEHTPQVDVVHLLQAIDKLEASVARLKRFLDGQGVE